MKASVEDDIFGVDEVKLLVEVEAMNCCCWNNNEGFCKYRERYNGLPALAMDGVMPTLNSSALAADMTNYRVRRCVQRILYSPLLK